MALTVIDSDVLVLGSLSPRTFTLPASAVANSNVAAAAGISASKLEHQYNKAAVLCDHATDAAAKRVQIHRVYGTTATILQFGVIVTVAATSTGAAVVNLRKNGSSILSATITVDSTVAVNTLKQPSGFTSTALAVGDVLEVSIDSVSGSTLPKGLSCHLVLREDAQ